MTKFTKKDQARYRAIVRELSRLSSNGWDRATHQDWEPLEDELAMLGRKMVRSNGDRTVTTNLS